MPGRFGELIDALSRPDVARVAVCAPSGYGKSSVLTEVAAQLRVVGTHVTHLAGEVRTDSLVVVDDAHRLDGEQLDRIRDHVLGGPGRLLLAYQPGRDTPGLRALFDAAPGPTFTLAPLTVDQTAVALRRHIDGSVSETFVRHAHSYTGGVPRFVSWLGEALRDGQDAADQRVAARLVDTLVGLDLFGLRLLITMDVCGSADIDVLAEVLATDRIGVADGIRTAQAAALAGASGALLPVVAAALRSGRLSAYRLATLHTVADVKQRSGQSVRDVAEALLEYAATGPTVAAAYLAGARELRRDKPGRAAALYAAAADAGARFDTFGTEWAATAALSGDFDTALRLVEPMLSGADVGNRTVAAGIGAAVVAHRADLTRSVELGVWAAGAIRHHAVIGLIGTGKPARAREMRYADAKEDAAAPPNAATGAAARTATAIEQSISAHPARALPALLGAAALADSDHELWPDSPAALAAIVALHSGELGLAHAVLDQALTSDTDGLFSIRHRALLGWVALTHGDTGAAREEARTARAARRPELRDELFLSALEVGIARREGDTTAVTAAWQDAYRTMMATSVDLFTLLPLAEMLVAAARLSELPRLRTHLDQADHLLAALGDPPLWTANLHWARLHAAVLGDDRDAAGHALDRLERQADTSRYGRALTRAARNWTAILAGAVDVDEVTAAVDELRGFGLRWDAARLAAQAATRTHDRSAMVTLLDSARRVRDHRDARAAEPGATGALSGREVEVARLVAAGLTYKQVGARLYISGKTVEHHVAKIRGKLGAASRNELLRRLRDLFAHERSGADQSALPGRVEPPGA